ncbi:protein translocase subunit SecF [Jannaschia sp. R86511]|uniref:protein translocase subunit SecF n=1 Tax=Jannaschia sp. R86511 TaxID=3093853 RepID=UPI0036D43170
MKFDRWGNRLYTGETSYDVVGRRRTWYVIAAVVLLISIGALGIRGLNLGIDFTGGASFQISNIGGDVDESLADAAVTDVIGASEVQATTIGGDSLRVRTGEVTTAQSQEIVDSLAQAYEVDPGEITSSFIGPTWGEQVSQRALQSLVVFLVLVGLVIAVYFRTWKMAVAALVALAHDLVITVGIYALIGLEVTPSTIIGFLTILGYSLYDTVVVFDKVRENTEDVTDSTTETYSEAANRAVNQTMVRSINTSIVALLPVASILFIGALLLGAGTLLDLSLALFIGIAVGTYSSIFLATPLLVHLREREEPLVKHARKVEARRAAHPVPAGGVALAEQDDETDLADRRTLLADKQLGQRTQPKRPPRRRR